MNKDVSAVDAARPRGPRAGRPDTRERIRLAARDQFLADGYRDVTMRSIAAAADVDVALVSYYFGNKNGLFSAAMSLAVSPAELIDAALGGDPHTLAERMLRTMLTAWDSPTIGGPLRTAAAAAISEPATQRLVAEAVEREIIDRLTDRLQGPDRDRRAAIFCSQIAGIIFTRYLLGVEPLATMSADEIAQRLAPSLQLILDP
ncbi:MAG: TetR family transcriptional regulator [Solirubrobacteraceae bacterium]